MSLGAYNQAMTRSPDAVLAASPVEVLEFVGQELRSFVQWSALSRRPSTLFLTVPAPRAPMGLLLGADSRVVLWGPPDGGFTVGLGRALEITAAGRDRVVHIRERADAVWASIARSTYPGIEPLTPRLFGGFAFAAGAASLEPWRDFGDARFVLPAMVYSCSPGNQMIAGAADSFNGQPRDARLALCVAAPGGGSLGAVPASNDSVEAWMAQHLDGLARVLDMLARAPEEAQISASVVANRLVGSKEMTGPALWRRQIQDIQCAIAESRCHKVVAARCRHVELARTIDPRAVCDVLDRRYPECHRFAFRFGSPAWFVGATPERLITRADERISTQALAGSIAARANSDARAAAISLLASHKDRREQDFVVQAIRAALEPMCGRLDVPEQPVIRELREVLHLETPITGILRQPVHILDLLAALHPTPAVGGVPAERAVSWIVDNEPMPRGWYAGPVGHFDARGQGEFAVAIRSGLVRDHEAFIYVGAGIVHDSDADAELAETELKQRALLGALGIES